MGATLRRRCLGWLVVPAVVVCTGCNAAGLVYMLSGAKEPCEEPRLLKIAPGDKDKDKEVKVVVLASSAPETRPEFVLADNELAEIMDRYLLESFKQNKDRVTIVAPRKVREYKNEHPDWYTFSPEDIGKHFDVDYVIRLDIRRMSMYESGSHNMLYRGRADITVSVTDMHDPDFGSQSREYHAEYPNARGPVPVDEQTPPELFRQAFLKFLGQHLSWYFCSHPIGQDVGLDSE